MIVALCNLKPTSSVQCIAVYSCCSNQVKFLHASLMNNIMSTVVGALTRTGDMGVP